MAFSLFSRFKTTLIDKEKSNSYYIQNGKYYYIQNGNRLAQGKNQLKNVSGPLLILDSDLAMDNKTVYYKSYPQPHVDRSSFVVDKFVKKDQNHVYDRDFFKLKIVPDADPNTFQYQIIDSVNWSIWARDVNYYFVSHHKVDVDYASFQIHNTTLAHDAHHVYIRNGVQLLNMARLARVPKKLNKHFLADNESVYYYSMKKGFQIMPINGMNVAILKEDEIKVGDTIISAYR